MRHLPAARNRTLRGCDPLMKKEQGRRGIRLSFLCACAGKKIGAKAACPQRADTSVGPYRGCNVDLYFGGVAVVDCAQRAGVLRTADRPRPYKGTGHVCWPCRGAPVCAPVQGSGLGAAGRHIGRPLQGRQRRFIFWWGCECLLRAAVEASLDPTKLPDKFFIYVGNGLARSAAHKKGASLGAPTCLLT